MEWLIHFGSELVDLTVQIAPYLMLGFLFAGLLYAWLPAHKMAKYLGKNNSASVFNAALLGVPLPLCSCGVIPAGVSFYRNGASKGSTVSFLISTPQTGVDSIFVTWSLLGWPMAVLRPLIAFISGVFGGLLTNYIFKKKPDTLSQPTEKISDNPDKKVNFLDMLRYAFIDFLEDIVKWLIIGLLIAAFIAIIIPDDFFLRYLKNDYLSMLVVLLVSVPLYVCATGSVPIAAVLMLKGLSPGAAIVFLMAGPATNAATISVIGNTMGRKTLFIYLFSIIAASMFFGILVNELIPREFFINSIHHIHKGEHQHEILPHWLQIGSAIILTILMINGLIRRYFLKSFKKLPGTGNSINTNTMNLKKILVEGMTCNHCKSTVENNLRKIPGISDINIELSSGKVIIHGYQINLAIAEKTINDLGYKYRGEIDN
jgi:uncharacterized membrane protein YraQ (UPF0718 family)/copper chaperone CopZ